MGAQGRGAGGGVGSRSHGSSPPRLAGLEAVLLEVPLGQGTPAAENPVTSIHLFAPAEPALLVDRQQLLTQQAAPDPPYWAFLWGGAHAVARSLVQHRAPGPGDRVLDLGCGLGLAGLVAARAGASVCFADLHRDPLAFAEASASRLGLTDTRFVQLDLHQDRLEERFDWIFAADLLYEPGIYGALADFLDRHRAETARMLITDRLLDAPRVFFADMAARGYVNRCRQVGVPEGGQLVQTRLHELSIAPA